jgi:SAM-dependent methyltransferase
VTINPSTQYITDRNLAARQALWADSRRDPPFDLYPWVLAVAGFDGSDGLRVLDIGCGNGAYERVLAEHGHCGTRVGVDLSMGMLALVTDAIRSQADAQALPFVADAFDVVLAPHMLYHVPDVVAAAQECRRVLRPEGRFVAITNGVTNMDPLKRLVEEAVGTGWRMVRPAEQHFSLENGAAQLGQAFASVERIDCPDSPLVVTDVDALAAYVGSVADHYEAEAGVAWSMVVERFRRAASEIMATDGELRFTNSAGAFVCH